MMGLIPLILIASAVGYTDAQQDFFNNHMRTWSTNQDVSVHLGSSGDLTCTASPWNPLMQLIWKRKTSGGRQWEAVANHGAISYNLQSKFDLKMTADVSPQSVTTMLTLNNATYEDMGEYKCEVTLSGATQGSVDFNVTVYENGTDEVVPVTNLKLANPMHIPSRRYGTSRYDHRFSALVTGAKLQWSRPQNTKYREHWSYSVHLEYVFNRMKTTKQYKLSKQYGTKSSVQYQLNDLEPCTVFKAWVSGHSQKYKPQPRRRSRYGYSQYGYNRYSSYPSQQLLPGIYRRTKSKPITFMTQKSVPLEFPKMENIEYSAHTDSKNNCSIIASYQPEKEPFGCPTLGFYLNVSTPATWPEPLVQKAVGVRTSISQLEGSMTYPVSITLYNKFGAGHNSHTSFVACGAPVPTAPEPLKVATENEE